MIKKTLLICLSLTFFLSFVIAADPSAASGAAAGLFAIFLMILFFGAIFLIPVIFILGLIFWILMLVDCVKREFPKEDEKIIWILVIVLTSYIGAIIYYFLVKKKNHHK